MRRRAKSGILRGINTDARPAAGALAGLTPAQAEGALPAGTVEFWDAHDLANRYDAEEKVDIWPSALLGAGGLTQGTHASGGGQGPFFAPGALGGGPALRLAKGSQYGPAGARVRQTTEETLNYFMLLRHPKDFVLLDVNEGSGRNTTLRVNDGVFRNEHSSMWGGSTQLERPYPHKKQMYLLRLRIDGPRYTIWQGRERVLDAEGLAPSTWYIGKFPRPANEGETLDLGFYLAVNGVVTDAEWDALRGWAGQRWNAPDLPGGGAGDDAAGAGNWLLWSVLLGAAGLAAYNASTGDEDEQQGPATKPSSTPENESSS